LCHFDQSQKVGAIDAPVHFVLGVGGFCHARFGVNDFGHQRGIAARAAIANDAALLTLGAVWMYILSHRKHNSRNSYSRQNADPASSLVLSALLSCFLQK
jgi:hypothetical protein